jgi:hypothetical protein
MSWVRPYEINGHCKRLNKSCQPGIKRCILKDKVRFADLGGENFSPGQKNPKERPKN